MAGQVAIRVTIDMLPDDVLLDIFDLFLDLPPSLIGQKRGKCWYTCVEDGEASFFNHHVAWICKSCAQPEDL
jgi:hypothetical protein